MDLTPGTTLVVRTRGGRVTKMDVPAATTQRYKQMQYAIGAGDIAVLSVEGAPAEASSTPPPASELEALRAEYEQLTGKKPGRMGQAKLREAVDKARHARAADGGDGNSGGSDASAGGSDGSGGDEE